MTQGQLFKLYLLEQSSDLLKTLADIVFLIFIFELAGIFEAHSSYQLSGNTGFFAAQVAYIASHICLYFEDRLRQNFER